MAWKGSRAKPPPERHGKLATCVSARGARAAGSAGAFPLARGRCRGGGGPGTQQREPHGSRPPRKACGRVRRPAAPGQDV
jgi:hypothetical protein